MVSVRTSRRENRYIRQNIYIIYLSIHITESKYYFFIGTNRNGRLTTSSCNSSSSITFGLLEKKPRRDLLGRINARKLLILFIWTVDDTARRSPGTSAVISYAYIVDKISKITCAGTTRFCT